MAGFVILDGEGTVVTVLVFTEIKAAIEHAKRLLAEETLHQRKPEVFTTEDRKSALVGISYGRVFKPHYFVQEAYYYDQRHTYWHPRRSDLDR